jgi:hypothetical protein
MAQTLRPKLCTIGDEEPSSSDLSLHGCVRRETGTLHRFQRKPLFVNINKRVIRVTTIIARKAPRKGRGEHSIEEKRVAAW